jgi:hypothetical protein
VADSNGYNCSLVSPGQQRCHELPQHTREKGGDSWNGDYFDSAADLTQYDVKDLVGENHSLTFK